MNRILAVAGVVGLAVLLAGMAAALTGADDRTRLIASAVMVTGMAVCLLALFTWASARGTAGLRASRRANERASLETLQLNHPPGALRMRRTPSGRG